MHRNFFIILFLISFGNTKAYATGEEDYYLIGLNKANERITILEKENAVLKARNEVFILENDKKFNVLTWPLGLLVSLLLIIFGFGAFRSVHLAKQEARKAFKEDFEKIKSDIVELKSQAERELAQITTIREVAEQRINK